MGVGGSIYKKEGANLFPDTHTHVRTMGLRPKTPSPPTPLPDPPH